MAAHHGFMVGQILAKLDFWPENLPWVTAHTWTARDRGAGQSPARDTVPKLTW